MRIGEVARALGINVQTLRYYERRGLIASPARRANGYRDYGPGAVERVRFIKRAQALGLGLTEIGRLLALRDGGTCADVEGIVTAHVARLDARIAELQALRQAIIALGADCGPAPTACAFLGPAG